MTAVRPGDVEGLLRRGPSKDIVATLVYGPDTGLVSDHVAALLRLFTSGSDDPFASVKLDGDVLAVDPARLVDEAGTLGLFGGNRTIHVRSGSRSFVTSVETLLENSSADAKVVLEAGDLNRSAPLRTLCERSPNALAIPCYADDERSLAQVIERVLGVHDMRIDPDARDWLCQSLGVDRRVSLSEIEKLALYARGQTSVALDDVEAVVSDVAASMLNTLVDAAFAGRRDEIERDYRRFRLEGLDGATVLGAASRHASALLSARLDHPDAAPSQITAAWRGLHFKRKTIVERHLARWHVDALRGVIADLHQNILDCRRSSSDLAHARASALLLGIAARA